MILNSNFYLHDYADCPALIRWLFHCLSQNIIMPIPFSCRPYISLHCDCQALAYFVWIKNGGIESVVLIMHNDPMDVSVGKSQLAKHFYTPDSCPSNPDLLIPTPGVYKRCRRCKAPVNLGAEIYLKADFPGLYEVFTSQVQFDRRYMIRVTA